MDYVGLSRKIIGNAWQDPITFTLCAIIFLYFVVALWFPKSPIFRNAGTILPSFGVLGTFVGVLISVSNFKLDEPTVNPLAEIIGGLQVAFVTSIAGLLCGLSFRIYQAIVSSKDGPPKIGPDEVYSLLKENNKDARENSKKLLDAIIGDSDGSLNSQLKLMRQDLNDFGKTLAEANTKAFIKALEKAISDFNKNLTEQLGDNFSKLNDAVGNLLIWQENNKKDMKELRQSLDRTATAIKSTENSISEIEKSSSKIPENVRGLSELLGALQAQLKDMEAHTKVFSDISEKASDALPRIEEVLTKYTQGIETSMSTVLGKFQETILEQRAGFDNLKNQFEKHGLYMKDIGSKMEGTLSDFATDFDIKIKKCLLDSEKTFDKIGRSFSDKIDKLTTDLETNLKKASYDHGTQLKQFSDDLTKQFNGSIEDLRKGAQKTLGNVQTALDDLMVQELNAFSQRLGGIANRLSDDYGPLSDNFKKLIEVLGEYNKSRAK